MKNKLSYEIKNNYTILKLELTSNEEYPPILSTFVNDSEVAFRQYESLTNQSPYKYEIPLNEYNVGDVISKFQLSTLAETHLWDTHEGIVWLLDGNEYSTKHNTNSETFTFDEQGTHTIEAVFVGNDNLELATTGKTGLTISQPTINESGSLDNNGAYKIQFVNKNLKSFEYCDNEPMEFILTKGGVPVTTGNRNIEIVTPNGVVSPTLDNKGKASRKNKCWDAGKYKLGAYYMDERNGRKITECWKTITVHKGTPKFTDNFASNGDFIKDSVYKLYLKFKGDPIAKTKLTMYVNGKSKTYTTDKYGAIEYKFDKTGTFVLKTVFKGNKNLNKLELTRTITVGKAHG